MKATGHSQQYFPVVMFVMLHKDVPTLNPVDGIQMKAIKQHFTAHGDVP